MYTSKRNTLWSALLLLIQFLSKGRVSVRVFQPPQFQWPRYAPGTPIGNSDFIRSQCIDIAKSGDRLCSELVNLNDSQSSVLILRHCHVPRLNYLARQIFPVDL